MVTRTQPLLTASSVQVGHTYRAQRGNTTPFTVLWITSAQNGYMVDDGHSSISNHRKAICRDAQGFYYVHKVYATMRYREVEE